MPRKLPDVFAMNSVLQKTVQLQAAELKELRTLRHKYQEQARELEELRKKVMASPSEESKHGGTPSEFECSCNKEREAASLLWDALKRT